MRRLAMAGVGLAVGLGLAVVGTATPASAAGYRGASLCSGAGAPTGTMPASFGNPGEAIAFTAQVLGHDGTFHPGPIVAINCNPKLR